MAEPPAGRAPAPITIASRMSRAEAIFFVLCLGALAVLGPFSRADWPGWAKDIPVPFPVVVIYLAVVGSAAAWLLYRGCRLGARFDDQGVAVCKLFRTQRYSWPEVSRFADGYGERQGGRFWALDIVLSSGQAVTVSGVVVRGTLAPPKKLAAIRQVAAHYQIPAEVTGIPRTREGWPATGKPGLHPDPGGKPGLRRWDGSHWSPFLQADPARDGQEAGKSAEVWSPLPGSEHRWHDAAAKARRARTEIIASLAVAAAAAAAAVVLYARELGKPKASFTAAIVVLVVSVGALLRAYGCWRERKDLTKIDQAGEAAAGLAGTGGSAVRPPDNPAEGR